MGSPTIRPSRERYRGALLASAGLAAALLVITLVQPTPGSMIGVGALAAAATLSALGVWLYWRNARIELAPGRVERTNLLGTTVSIPHGSVASTVIVLQLVGLTATPVPGLLLLGPDGETLLRMRGEAWDVESMAELGAAVPVAPIVLAEPITVEELRRRFPGVVGSWEAHPTRIGLAIAAVVVVLITATTIVR